MARADRPVPDLVFHPGLAVVDGEIKYVATANGHERAFDLGSDPGEMNDLLPRRPELAGRFASLRAAWVDRRAQRPSQPDPGPVAAGEIADHLRELGYIE
jgi:hypothetical protein